MRTLLAILFVGVFVLLLILTIKAAGINRSLRRIEHEERRRNLVVWYLMAPPPVRFVTSMTPPPMSFEAFPSPSSPCIGAGTAAPVSQWTIVTTFPMEKECEAHRRRLPFSALPMPLLHGPGRGHPMITFTPSMITLMRVQEQCVRSDDPRLKK
jgi:hypothetical protein